MIVFLMVFLGYLLIAFARCQLSETWNTALSEQAKDDIKNSIDWRWYKKWDISKEIWIPLRWTTKSVLKAARGDPKAAE